jgi:amino acid adenylation domain-containing protein
MAIVSSDESFPHHWKTFTRLSDVIDCMDKRPDLLLSIANRFILTKDQIDYPNIAAINYHDSLLPTYAGVNAPSWAILNGESRHGITWHLMEADVDAGPILTQKEFAIDSTDTSLSLSSKCFEHALHAFDALLDSVETGELRSFPQDLSKRTVFFKQDRLPRQGIIRWSETADLILRSIRAAQFGPYSNDFGLAKVLLPDGKLIVVGRGEIAGSASSIPAGTVMNVDSSSITVTTGDERCVSLFDLNTLDGQPATITTALQDRKLPEMSEADEDLLESMTIEASAHEERIRQTFCSMPAPLRPHGLRPWKHNMGGEYEFVKRLSEIPSIGNVMAKVLRSLLPEDGPLPALVGIARESPMAFMPVQPLICTSNNEEALAELINRQFCSPRIASDFVLRYPDVRRGWSRFESLSICLANCAYSQLKNPGLVVCFQDGFLSLRFAANQISSSEAEGLAEEIFGVVAGELMSQRKRSANHLFVHLRISEQAVAAPDAIAIECGEERLTYGDLEKRSEILASRLRKDGGGPEKIYGILLPQGIDFAVAVVGILKSGSAYLPLDILMPLQRIKQIIQDAKPLAIITNESQLNKADLLETGCICLDNRLSAIDLVFRVRTEPEDLAYIIYTSGTTGAPKGTMIEHRSLAHVIDETIARNLIGVGDRVLQLCSVAFDASVEEMFTALCAGATLVIRPAWLLDAARTFLTFCDTAKLTIIGLYPSMLKTIIDEMEVRGSFPRTVRLITTGGERVRAEDIIRWQKFFSNSHQPKPLLINVYGLTETTIANIVADLSHQKPLSGFVPIGYPLPGNELRVVDEDRNPVSPGETGELLISGVQLARAYLNREDITAQRFFVDPDDYTRWFCTGDQVRIGPHAELYFIGRNDRQVKVNGVRIELDEIERAIQSYAAVKESFAMIHRYANTTEALVVFYVCDPPALESDLRDHLAALLPKMMLPHRYVRVRALPINDRGKIDSTALGELLGHPHSLADAKETEFLAATDLNRQLHAIWFEVLGHGDFATSDNFFAIGGDSLSATRLLFLIEQRLGQRLTLASLFQSPTLTSLATRLAGDDILGRHQFRSLVTIQSQGEAFPLYVVHGGGGDVFIHLQLARCLAPRRPVYGLQAVGMEGSEVRQRSVEEMASHYASEILRFQPQRPIHLLGYSGGGWYAWAVAAEILRRGGCLGLVGLVDTGGTADLHRRLRLQQILLHGAQRILQQDDYLRAIRSLLRRNSMRRIYDALCFHGWTLLRIPGGKAPQARDPDAKPQPTQPIRGDYFLQLHTYYRPPRLPVRVDIFSAHSAEKNLRRLWNFYSRGKAYVHPVLLDHNDYYNADFIPAFTDCLEALIDEAEGREPSRKHPC